MNKKWINLAVNCLEDYADRIGCAADLEDEESWEAPSDWDERERQEFLDAIDEYLGEDKENTLSFDCVVSSGTCGEI